MDLVRYLAFSKEVEIVLTEAKFDKIDLKSNTLATALPAPLLLFLVTTSQY